MSDDATSSPIRDVVTLVARLVLGGMFVKMGLAKVGDPVAFLKLLRQYEMVPEGVPWLLNGPAIVLPWLEVWLGSLLVLGVAVRGVSTALLAMLIVFTTAVALRGVGLAEADGVPLCEIAFDCGCGSGVVPVCDKLVENGVLALLALVGALSASRRWCLKSRLVDV